MHFSKDIQTSNYFLSQPHQPFFVLAFINAIISMLLFMLSFKGIILLNINTSFFHAYALIFMLFTPAFLGFLFTTFPRFSNTAPITQKRYVKIWILFMLGSLFFTLGVLFNPIIYTLGMVLLIAGHVWASIILIEVYKNTEMSDTYDIYWILLSMLFGLLSHVLFMISELFWSAAQNVAIQVGIYLYLFMVAFSVAQRMVPFFSHCMIEKNMALLKIVTALLVARILIMLTYPSLVIFTDSALAFIIAKELINWKLPFPNSNPLLWILHISLFWVPVAFGISALSQLLSIVFETNFLFLDIHILMLGFVFTVLIGFGTRVTLGHSGNMMQADSWVKNLFIMTQIVVLMRIVVSLAAGFSWNFMILFDISATLWIFMFIVWAVRFFAVLIKGKRLN